MGILPIGFFSPLPLAIMIPFMATQSLAMGEAFGKSFQYGKRKISSMTNEEFNKYTFNDMMNEQTANVRSYIPKLHEQMELSYTLQIDIFEEMVKIIPAFFEALLKSLQPLSQEFSDFNKTPTGQTIPHPDIQPATFNINVDATHAAEATPISHSELTPEIEIIDDPHFDKTWKHSLFEISSASEARLRLWLRDNDYNTSEERRAIFDAQQKGGANLPSVTGTSTGQLAPSIAKNLDQAKEFTAWQANLIRLQSLHTNIKHPYSEALRTERTSGSVAHTKKLYLLYKRHADQIKNISRDYRNPNPAIGRAVLELRQEIANGLWNKPKFRSF